MNEAGRGLYSWLEDEVIVEINDELQIDLSRELERVTAYSSTAAGIVIVVEGPLEQATRERILALAGSESPVDARRHGGREYFFAGREPAKPATADPLGDLDSAAYFSFAVANRLLITSGEAQLRELLDNGGRIAGGGNHAGALFVLSADKNFVQAGLRAEHFADDSDDNWNSNILRNTEQAALLVADKGGMLAVEARLKSRDERMAQSIGSVVNGLIGLQVFNEDLDPQLRELIRNTRVEVTDAVLSISTVLDPDTLTDLLANREGR
ncbi:MAG: hypothetical protein U5K76_10930 [Woeseiaceae bacterium]|nr:hypothetical protein [Woeseiaceae bacterium]